MTRFKNGFLTLSVPLLLAILYLVSGGLAPTRAAEPIVLQSSQLPLKSVTGTVQTRDGDPVAGALVIAYRINRHLQATAVTAADGSYTLALAPGLWNVSVEPQPASIPIDWIYTGPPVQVEFRDNNEPEQHVVDFIVQLADAVVKGVIAMPDGSVPPFPVVISLRNGEGHGGRTLANPLTGAFRLALPHGRYKIFIHPLNDKYAGPDLEPVLLPPGQMVDLGTIKLMTRSATITGKVVDENGQGVAGMPVTAWQRDRPAMFVAHTGLDGSYKLEVVGGIWHVQPSPGPDQPYLYLGDGQRVEVAAGETVSGVDFKVLTANATIAGMIVDENGALIGDISGWATAISRTDANIRNGGPIRGGLFKIHVPAGDYVVTVDFPPGTPYIPPDGVHVTVAAGETANVKIPVRQIDAAIRGALIDPRRNLSPVTGVPGKVSAWNGDRLAMTPIRPDTGTYFLPVTAGVWHLNYGIDHEDYVKLRGGANIPVEDGQIVPWPLPITRKDGGISGQVLDPFGDPLPGATVVVQGLSGDIRHLRLRTQTDEDGLFRLAVPHGRYRVGALGGDPAWINPVDLMVGVAPNQIVSGLLLKFHEPDARLAGTLTVLNAAEAGEVLVWAWSERGGFNLGYFPVEIVDDQTAQGDYSLGVLQGTVWHVGAVMETEDAFWFTRTRIKPEEANVTLDLELEGPFPKPPPVVVTFPADEAQRLTLADGTSIFIPAGAMPVTGEVTLRIVPLATVPHQRHARIIRYGYAFFASDENGEPIEAHFNHDVIISFTYSETDLGRREIYLKPAYFSTTTNEWTVPDRFVIDPMRNQVKMAIDHFTDFALVEDEGMAEIFLPTVIRD